MDCRSRGNPFPFLQWIRFLNDYGVRKPDRELGGVAVSTLDAVDCDDDVGSQYDEKMESNTITRSRLRLVYPNNGVSKLEVSWLGIGAK